ncbi:MAG TPA: hypothetical protein VFZ73_06365 [Gemmatimonadaceae bacterium]
MARLSLAYVPRRAADSVLYQVVRDHYETFAAQAAPGAMATACRDSSTTSFADS